MVEKIIEKCLACVMGVLTCRTDSYSTLLGEARTNFVPMRFLSSQSRSRGGHTGAYVIFTAKYLCICVVRPVRCENENK
jgi:hypothetical protein